MTKVKPIVCALLLTLTLSSAALAGNIPVTRATGNIPVTRATGNIPVPRAAGNIPVPRASGNIPVPRSAWNMPSFSENIGRLIQLLVESGALF
jgi:hypothetical protein